MGIKAREDASKCDKWVRLDVGGQWFAASSETFLRWEGTYFHALVQGNLWAPGVCGLHCIDRNPEHFDRIMTSLRTGDPVDFSGLSSKDAMELLDEMDYYQLDIEATRPQWDSKHLINFWVSTESTLAKCTVPALFSGAPSSFRVSMLKGGAPSFGYATSSGKKHWLLDCEHGVVRAKGQEGVVVTEGIKLKRDVSVCFDKTSETISYELDDGSGEVVFRGVRCDEPLFPWIQTLEG